MRRGFCHAAARIECEVGGPQIDTTRRPGWSVLAARGKHRNEPNQVEFRTSTPARINASVSRLLTMTSSNTQYEVLLSVGPHAVWTVADPELCKRED